MTIAFLGYGQVGAPLADHLQRLGHDVVLACHNPESASTRRALERNAALRLAEPSVAVSEAQVVFLATPFQNNEEALSPVAAQLEGKILVDCTNPVGPGLSHGLASQTSGSQQLQTRHPQVRVVKAFTIYGFENFENNRFPGESRRPVMMYCGDDPVAKTTVGTLIGELGWEPLDVGGLAQALHLEHMTLLWIRMVRVSGASPRTVWAVLQGDD